MQRQLLIIAIVGILIIGAVTAGGYYLGKVIQKPETSPEETALTTEPIVSPSPSVTPSSSGLPTLPTAPPAKKTTGSQVKGETTTNNTTPVTASTGPSIEKNISIRFIGIPSQVQSNTPFVVSWFIDGPEGMMGSSTRLTSVYKVGSSGSSSSSTTSQSFGAFQIPQKFQSNVQFGGNSGPVVLTATAEINGKTYSATQTINLVN